MVGVPGRPGPRQRVFHPPRAAGVHPGDPVRLSALAAGERREPLHCPGEVAHLLAGGCLCVARGPAGNRRRSDRKQDRRRGFEHGRGLSQLPGCAEAEACVARSGLAPAREALRARSGQPARPEFRFGRHAVHPEPRRARRCRPQQRRLCGADSDPQLLLPQGRGGARKSGRSHWQAPGTARCGRIFSPTSTFSLGNSCAR